MGYRESFLQVPCAPLFAVTIRLEHLRTEIVRGQSVETVFTKGIKGCSRSSSKLGH